MNKEKAKKSPRKPKLWEALLSFAVLIVIMAVGIVVFEQDPHVPMVIGTAFAACMALRLGYKWKDIETAMYDGIYNALQACIILIIIGMLIGVWLVSGVVPTMIYYGLMVMSPGIFLVATLIICSITSLATGTSWGTAGTIGIALMGVAVGLGIPAPIAAGAILSGAYFGDKMSPLSDTTNLAPAMAGTDVFTHAKFMIKSTLPVYMITIVVFLIIGLRFGGSNADMSSIELIKSGITDSFNISPILLLPPIMVIIFVALKMPAVPGIFLGIILGGILGIFTQGASLGDLLSCGFSGFVSETGSEAIDELLTAGGIEGMLFSVSLTIIAMTFGGVMEKTGQLEVIVSKLITLAKGTASLVTMTVITCFASNITMPEQYISIVVPGRMYASTYRKRGLHPKMLSNALESGGTTTGALVPWNTCGAFMTTTLGVATIEYLPYAVFNYLMPLACIIMTFLGLLTVRIEDDPGTVIGCHEETPANAGAETEAKAAT